MVNKYAVSSVLMGLMMASSGAYATTPVKKEESAITFKQTNFVANKADYKPELMVDEKMINAWGIAIRPAGAGGHFWVTAKDMSIQYVGDVRNSPDEKLKKIHQDELKYVKIPLGNDEAFTTSTVFSAPNEAKDNFVITQDVKGEKITRPATFLFGTDGGVISAWTEEKQADGTFKRSDDAITVIDQSKEGAAFFGITLNKAYDRLYAADFGEKPAVKVFDKNFKPVDIKFDQPFDENKNGQVDAGEYAPFNVQQLVTPTGDSHIFVAYAKTQPCPEEEVKKETCKAGELFVGEEDTSKAGYGRVAEFTEDGKLVKVLNDDGKLSAPWGLAFAPKEGYGKLSSSLLVGNFGSGEIAAYNLAENKFIDLLKNEENKPVVIDQLWGILFGNGASLGDTDSLYFAAGPQDEVDGLFGRLRPSNAK